MIILISYIQGIFLAISVFIHLVFLILGEKEYYEKQFATLRAFEEVDSLDSPDVTDEDQAYKEQAQHERAMNISNCANIFLLAFKVISLSLVVMFFSFASMLHSILM